LPLILPEQAGFRVGKDSTKAIMMQVHYDNRNLESGLLDNSGIRIYYTDQLRKYDATALTIGDTFVTGFDIPAGQSAQKYEYDCPTECTTTWKHDITVFAQWMHMHEVGSKALTTQWRKNQFVQEISRVEFWDFRFQQTEPLKNVTIQRGDILNLHCYFDTTNRVAPTRFAAGSLDEMCVQLLYYYPALEHMPNCGYVRDKPQNNNDTVCGFFADRVNVTTHHVDPVGMAVTKFGRRPSGACTFATTGDIGSGKSDVSTLNSLFALTLTVALSFFVIL
jgi:hypothetical protein